MDLEKEVLAMLLIGKLKRMVVIFKLLLDFMTHNVPSFSCTMLCSGEQRGDFQKVTETLHMTLRRCLKVTFKTCAANKIVHVDGGAKRLLD